MEELLFYIGIKWSYLVTFMLLLTAYFIIKKHRAIITEWRSCMYIMMFVIYVFYFGRDCIDVCSNLKIAFGNVEGYDFHYSRYHYGFFFWGYFLFEFIIFITFWLRLFRQTFAWGLLITGIVLSAEITSWIASLFRDYLPSSLSISYRHSFIESILSLIVFNAVIAIIFLLRKVLNDHSVKTLLLKQQK